MAWVAPTRAAPPHTQSSFEDTTIDGKKAVDSQAMGGCNTKLSPDGEKFVYIDCAQLQEGILQVQDHQHHGCGASLRAVKFGLPRRLRDGHGPGVFAIPIRWSAAIGEACGWRGIARTKGHGEIHMAHRAAGKGHREQ